MDPEQVRAGGRVAPIEELLQRFDIGGRLVHIRSKSRFSSALSLLLVDPGEDAAGVGDDRPVGELERR
jgi:hypothetical protein